MSSFATYQNLNIKTLKQLKHLFKRIDPATTIGRKASAKDAKSYNIKMQRFLLRQLCCLTFTTCPSIKLPDLKYMLE
jgi:hypothetical protein